MSAQEKNTVVLSLEEYNLLRDFRKGIEDGNTIEIYDGHFSSGYWPILKFCSTDEAVKKIAKENAVLLSKIKELEAKNEPKERTVSEVKKMSVREFRKWRRQ